MSFPKHLSSGVRPRVLSAHPPRHRNLGFTLLELMLVLAAIVVLTTLTFAGQVRDRDLALAKATGDQLKNIGGALNEYIVTYHDPLVNLVSAPNPTDDGGPRICDTGSNMCTINVNTLINAGVLPPGFRGITPYQSAYVIQIKRRPIGATGNFSLDGLVVTALPWITGGTTPRYDLLGAAIQQAGADAGMSRASATEIDGYNGMWSALSSDFPSILKAGQLGYRAGYSANAYGAFLRVDGSNNMTGPLNMHGNTIYNVQDLQATGGVEANSVYVDGGVIQLGKNPTSQIFANTAAGLEQTVFQQQDGVLIVKPDGTPADIAAVNNIRAQGNITTQGQVIVNEQLQIKNSNPIAGGLSLYNNGALANTGMVYTDKIQVAADPSTGLNPATDATTRLTVFGSGFTSQDWSVYRYLYANSFNAVSGNTVTFGDKVPTSVLFNNDIYVKGNVYLNGPVTSVAGGVLAGCTSSQVGAITRTNSGGLVICDSTQHWKPTSILTTVVQYGNPTTTVNVASPVYCNVGSFATGGGYRRTAIINAAANPLPMAPIDATPIPAGVGGTQGGYQVTAGTTDVQFTPFVTCAVVND